MKNTEIQELIKAYAEQKQLDCRTARELLQRILKIVLSDLKRKEENAGDQEQKRTEEK